MEIKEMGYSFRIVPSTLDSGYFSGKALIATPWIGDPFFHKTVVFICAHHNEGAVGIIVNKPCGGVTTRKLHDVLQVRTPKGVKQNKRYKIYTGGMIEDDKYYILAEEELLCGEHQLTFYTDASSFLVNVLKGKNTKRFLMFKGFCLWYPGLLEREINENAWMIADMDYKMLFESNDKTKWDRLVKSVGIKDFTNLVMYSSKI